MSRRAGLLLACALLAAHAPDVRAVTVQAIPKTSVWRYLATPLAPDPTWKDTGYDDAGWTEGLAPLGYAYPFINTPVPYGPDPNNKWITTYFRTEFTVTVNPADIVHMLMEAEYDDGFVAYLNGQEIVRRSMPAGPVDWGTLAISHEATFYEQIDMAGEVGKLQPGTNVLALELHQQAPTSSDLALDLSLRYSSDSAGVVRGPYLQSAHPTGVVVRWRTDFPAASTVRVGETLGVPTLVFTDPVVTTEHEVPLSGLSPNTRYYYSVGTPFSVQEGDNSHTFLTPPVAGTPQPVRLWAIGDAGLPGINLVRMAGAYASYTGTTHTDAWLMLGDNAYSTGTDDEYQNAVFNLLGTALRGTFLWPTRGNHDVVHAGPNNDYYDIFTLPTDDVAGGLPSGTEAYYAFDHANVHFVCLDSEGSDNSPGSPMLDWLRADLASTSQDWIIAFWHHPPYSKGSHDSDDPGDSGGRLFQMRENVLPILDSTGVDLVLTGHSHSYERSFLLSGHWGTSGTLLPSMIVDGGDGREDGDGPYAKPTPGKGPLEGSVHVVAGSSSRTGGGTLDHPVMIASINAIGSLVVDVAGNRLDARMLDTAMVVRDSFTIVKGPTTGLPVAVAAGAHLRLATPRPTPSRGATELDFEIPHPGPVRLAIHDVAGRRIAMLLDGFLAAGSHRVSWPGDDTTARTIPPGVYFAVLEHAGARRAVRVVMVE